MRSPEVASSRGPVRQNLVLGICCMSVLLIAMDVTIVNVALPAIQHDLQASLSGLQWIIDAYTLVIASLLMLSGSMSDRFGRRRVFQIGLTLFVAGSLLCTLAHTIDQLVAYRALQVWALPCSIRSRSPSLRMFLLNPGRGRRRWVCGARWRGWHWRWDPCWAAL